MRISKSLIVGFFSDSVLEFSTETDIFIKHLKNWIFYIFR